MCSDKDYGYYVDFDDETGKVINLEDNSILDEPDSESQLSDSSDNMSDNSYITTTTSSDSENSLSSQSSEGTPSSTIKFRENPVIYSVIKFLSMFDNFLLPDSGSDTDSTNSR